MYALVVECTAARGDAKLWDALLNTPEDGGLSDKLQRSAFIRNMTVYLHQVRPRF